MIYLVLTFSLLPLFISLGIYFVKLEISGTWDMAEDLVTGWLVSTCWRNIFPLFSTQKQQKKKLISKEPE